VKVLSENNISSLSGKDLGFYLDELSHHKAINALNDIPSVQWVAGFPDPGEVENSLSFNSSTGRFELTSNFYVESSSSVSCIYFGKFKTDRLVWSANFNYENGSVVDPAYPSDNYSTEIEVPIRIYDSLKDFVTGKSIYYTDYFKTLDELLYLTPYIISQASIRVQLISEYDILRHSQNKELGFKSISASTIEYPDASGNIYYIYNGNLIDIRTEELVSISYNQFTSNLNVGCFILFHKTKNTNDTEYYSPFLGQIISVKGDGSEVGDITIISNVDFATMTQQNVLNQINSNGNPVADEDQPNIGLIDTFEIQQILTDKRIGLIRVGNFEEFPNPQVGLSKAYKDYSVRTELINGGHQYINRNVAKTFSGSMIIDRDQVNRLRRFANTQRAKPFPMEVLTGMDLESPTSIFCVFDSPPTENYSYRTGEVRDVSFSIKQIF
jgi:hypothetical protein